MTDALTPDNHEAPSTGTVLPSTLWDSLPDALQHRISANSAIYQQGTETSVEARSQKHLLWEIAAELRQAADEDRAAAESLAKEALTADGDVIDECLARTILIELYTGQPDKEAEYEMLCLETIALVSEFNRAWRALQKQDNSDLSEAEIIVPRLDAFDHLIRLYEQRGDAATALDIALQAQEAGYDEYRNYATGAAQEKSSRQSILFLWVFFAPLTAAATGAYTQALQQESVISLIPMIVMSMLWIVTLMLLISAEARQILLQIPRFLRRVPWLLWLILLEGILLWLYQWELQRFDVLQRSYSAWVLAWTLMLLLFAGITRPELNLMKRRLAKSRLTGIMISLTTLFLILIGTELALRHMITFSNSYAIGLNHRRWMEQYELPQVNTLGYRDYPYDRIIPAAAKRVVVVGDSFASGFGVNDIANTFPHLLDTQLDNAAAVHVMAKPGWETDAILRELPEYPVKPDILVYSYFLNDILYLDPTQTDQWRALFAEPPLLLAPVIDNFYLPEVLYWNIYRQWLTGGDAGYGNIIQEIYENNLLWEMHNDDFIRLIEWSSAQDTSLVILIWPLLIQPEETAIYTRRVEDFFQGRGIPVVNMSDYIIGKTPAEMTVNPFDMHPNETMHQLAANELYETLSSTGLIQIDESP